MKKVKNPYIGLEEQGYNCFACCPTNPCGLKMRFYEDVYLDDLKTYASYGIKHITTYACWADANYVKMYGDVSFIDKYGQGLLNYRHEE